MKLKGTFKQLIFSASSGYVVGLFRIKESPEDREYENKTITITGYFVDIKENENYILDGEFIEHIKYGTQFNVTKYEVVKPEDKDGIVAFLSSSLFRGVGEKLATRIVDTLGDKTLDLILEDKDNLMRVYKMNQKKANDIYNTLLNYQESHKTIIYLTELGFTNHDALAIYNCYKNNTLKVIEHDIYRLLDDIDNLSFLKIDKIALNSGINPLDDKRLEALTYYVMQNISFQNGDTYLEYEEIKFQVSEFLNYEIDDNTLCFMLDNLVSSMKVIIIDDKYYLYDIYESEYNICQKIKNLVNKKKEKYTNIDDLIVQLENIDQINYNDEQIDAIKKALNNNITIITGGPGVGKTTIIKAILNIYNIVNDYTHDMLVNKVALLAPTGRAAKRMSEATNFPALTIHRFLKWNKETNEFQINEYHKSNVNLVIIDEASMIDINLLNSLFLGLKDNIKLVLVGDYNQLPSVGPGNILKDIIESNTVETVCLNHLYRQTEDSYIPVLSKEIKDNELKNYLNKYDDYIFMDTDNESIIARLTSVCEKLIKKGYNYYNTQIMAPMYAGLVGIDNLNRILQDIFNPKDKNKKEIKYGDQIFRVGDKVLQLQNMVDLNVFNGDIGIIEDITDEKEIVINFDGNYVYYTIHDLVNIKHGYVISIHKSQGSEFKLVIMILSNSFRRLLYRKLIYTGVTRAKSKLIIIGQSEAFEMGVKNVNEKMRKTLLKDKLIECIK
ncbi:MAG: ATP-dependent RecD-like DNA helicase [Bacilli bacterium]|nr:ATP-dependent RecD-like DNA helicase [Bacilli bacterium]